MFKTVVADSHAQKLHWVDLVALMSPEAVRQIRERAEKVFLSTPLLDELANQSLSAPCSSESLEAPKLYLTIIEELASSIPDSGTPSIVPVLVEKLETLLHKIIISQGKSNVNENRSGFATKEAQSNFERSLAFWFSALLRMVVIHRTSFLQPSPALKVASQEQSRLLASIFCIALSRLPGNGVRFSPGGDYFPRSGAPKDYRPCPGTLLQTHALDVAASLIDVFPDEIRHNCSRFLREKCPPFVPFQNDSRFLYLLGPTSDVNVSTLVQSTSAPSPAASGSTPTPISVGHPAIGSSSQQPSSAFGHTAGMAEVPNSMTSRLRLQQRGRIIGPYPIRPWELLEDAAPFAGVNDTAVNLGYFDARRVRV